MKRCLLPLLLAGLLFSCSNDLDEVGATKVAPNGSGNAESKYAVSVEEALSHLAHALQPSEDEVTRSDYAERRIGAVRPVKAGEVFAATRAESLPDVGDLFYLVEFENGEGSAVLAADRRMSPIYAILDETVLSPADFSGVATRAENDEAPADIKDYLVDLMKAAAYNDISTADENDGESDDSDGESDNDGGVSGGGGIGDPGGPTIPTKPLIPTPSTWYDEEVQTIIVCRQTPLLETKWDQGWPYNNLCFDKLGNVCPAGCVAIACAQIMFYHREGETITVTGKTFNWELLEEFKYEHPTRSAAARDEMARFIRHLGSALVMKYDENGSTSNINRAEALFKHLNYKGTDAATFSDHINVARNLINKKLPFYLRGISANSNSGHAWVVDGWNEYYNRYTITKYDLEGNIVSVESTDGPRTQVIHCNFGWAGECDGYYCVDLFNTSVANSSIDSSVGDIIYAHNDSEYIFSKDFKFINYTK